MTVAAAPAGSGKTVLLRSWISQEGLAGRAAWVAAGREEQDPQRFWLSVVGALRRTAAGAGLVRAVSAAPDLDGWAVTERLLLRTSILERVNGELADLLTGDEGAERVPQDLETRNAFVVSLDADRSWFRYHQLFAGLLQLELRRTAPGEVAGLHQAASAWFAGHQHPVEAIRHAQAARDWSIAVRLLADHWPASGSVHRPQGSCSKPCNPSRSEQTGVCWAGGAVPLWPPDFAGPATSRPLVAIRTGWKAPCHIRAGWRFMAMNRKDGRM